MKECLSRAQINFLVSKDDPPLPSPPTPYWLIHSTKLTHLLYAAVFTQIALSQFVSLAVEPRSHAEQVRHVGRQLTAQKHVVPVHHVLFRHVRLIRGDDG